MDYARIFSSLQSLLQDGHTRREDAVFQADPRSYFAEDRFRDELALFERLPLLYGPTFPGGVNFRSFQDYNSPLIITRSGDDYHAFPNICQHRAATLTQEKEGQRKTFTCPYHAWTYDVKGEILAIPEKESFPNCPVGRRRPHPQVETALGALWVCLRPDKRLVPATDAYLEDLRTELAPAIAHYKVPYREYREEFPFNWKFVIDAVLENYHVSTLHHATFRNVLHGNLGLHLRSGLHAKNYYPFKNLRGRTAAGNFAEIVETTSFVYHLFPNTIFSIQPMFAAFFTAFPITPTRCEVRSLYLVPEEIGNPEMLERGIALTVKGVKEDHDLLEQVSRNLQSRWAPDLLFGKQEGNLGFFHQNLQRLIERL